MNNNEPPKKNPRLGKQAFLTLETMPDTPKTNLLILKPQKTNPKNTILPCSKTTHYFS